MNGQPDIIQPVVQQPLDVHTIHKSVIDMFPELDLTQTLRQFGHLNSEALASVILDTIKNIPPKRGQKRKVSEVINENPPSVSSEQSFTSENSNEIGKLLIDKMLWDMLGVINIEYKNSKHLSTEGVNLSVLKNAMSDHFPLTRLEFITKVLSTFNGAIYPSSLACFFIENGFAEKLRKAFPNLSQNFWSRASAPLQKNRNKKACHSVPEDFSKQYKLFTDLLVKYRDGEYSALITADLKLSKHYHQIEWQRPTEDERIECLVCFDLVPLNRVIFCNDPVQSSQDFLASQLSAFVDNFDEPGPSSAIYEELERIQGQKDKENADPQVHAFCKACVRGSASAAVGEVPMAKGGIAEIRLLLPSDVRKKLDERIVEENIGMASLINLERCKKCNFAIDMEVDKETNKVFDCLACGYKMCRLCERDWDDEHFGITCKELDEKTSKDKRDRELEKQLNEAVIRKCPRCGIQFMKELGCNKMTCRCGMTQCYICRESGIGYDHFCPHVRDPLNPQLPCKDCKKTCLLHEDAKKKDEQLIQEIRQKGVGEVQNKTTLPNTAHLLPPTLNAPVANVAHIPPVRVLRRRNNNNNQERNLQQLRLAQERLEQARDRYHQQVDPLIYNINAVPQGLQQARERTQQGLNRLQQHLDFLLNNLDGLPQGQQQQPQHQPPRQFPLVGDQQLHQQPVPILRGQGQQQRNPAFPYQHFVRAGEVIPPQPAPNQAVNQRLYDQVYQQPHPPQQVFRPYQTQQRVQQPTFHQQPHPIHNQRPQQFLNEDYWIDDYLGFNYGGANNLPQNRPLPQQQGTPNLPPFPRQQLPQQFPQPPPPFPRNAPPPPPPPPPPQLPPPIGDNFIDRYLGDAFQVLNNNNNLGAPNMPIQLD
ncbi:hypothetical protein Mgra_00006011 [Meloidogyne graminicola]|uniref:RING-type domain-containing protein n=1 Tax=Meloidogyne graminicola TaxID=189291 RepID=A0A8S9ZMU6_9BILA|nr:hypothetical protein Mgra_00006011 [Meloidogyne graminicola]